MFQKLAADILNHVSKNIRQAVTHSTGLINNYCESRVFVRLPQLIEVAERVLFLVFAKWITNA